MWIPLPWLIADAGALLALGAALAAAALLALAIAGMRAALGA